MENRYSKIRKLIARLSIRCKTNRLILSVVAGLTAIAAGAIVYGCAERDTEVSPLLDRAEMVMESRPDSALVMLDSIEATVTLCSLMSDADRARHALLLTQARHKNYIDETSDSLITTAVDYYELHSSSEPFRLMLSRYYQGVIRSNARNYASAIVSLMKAESLAESIRQPLWLGRSQVEIAGIYNEVHSPADEVRYVEKARETFKNSNDSLNLWQADESLVIALNNADRYEEALRLAKKRYDIAASNEDTLFMKKSLEHIGYSLQHLNRHQEAVDAFRKFQALSPEGMEGKYYYYLSTALWNAGRHDESRILIDSILQMFGDEAEVHPGILYDLGRVEEAYRQQKADFSEANDFVRDIFNQNVSSSVSQYYNNEIAAHEAKLKQNRIVAVIIIIGVVIIAALIAAFLSYKISVTRREKLKKDEEVVSLADEIASLELKLTKASEKLTSSHEHIDTLSNQSTQLLSEKSKIETERLNVVSLLCEIYYSASSDSSGKSQKVEEALAFIKSVASDPSLISSLEEKIDRENGGLMRKFKEQMPGLVEREYIVFICGVLRISPIAIQYIWDIKRTTFYSLRQRLRAKIEDKSPTDISIFLRYLR